MANDLRKRKKHHEIHKTLTRPLGGGGEEKKDGIFLHFSQNFSGASLFDTSIQVPFDGKLLTAQA